MRFVPKQLANATSMGASFKSNGVDLNQIVVYSVEAVWTGGTADGTLNLEVSNDDVPVAAATGNPVGTNPAANVVNWVTYTGSSTTVSGAGNFLWNCLDAGYRWVRVSYTRSSGTGSCSIQYSGKGV